LCERVPTEQSVSDATFVVAPDTVRAMNALAAAYSQDRRFKVVAVTGSVGKTTTKEFVASVLPKDRTYRTKGNYNSVIGFPLSFVEIPESGQPPLRSKRRRVGGLDDSRHDRHGD
ncbi:MAG: hypothetical protein IJ991_04950, partial [Thermoguttaceae bacterium]|nr:hypothetical protein [Thermoguttaceae bacterium]